MCEINVLFQTLLCKQAGTRCQHTLIVHKIRIAGMYGTAAVYGKKKVL